MRKGYRTLTSSLGVSLNWFIKHHVGRIISLHPPAIRQPLQIDSCIGPLARAMSRSFSQRLQALDKQRDFMYPAAGVSDIELWKYWTHKPFCEELASCDCFCLHLCYDFTSKVTYLNFLILNMVGEHVSTMTATHLALVFWMYRLGTLHVLMQIKILWPELRQKFN